MPCRHEHPRKPCFKIDDLSDSPKFSLFDGGIMAPRLGLELEPPEEVGGDGIDV